MGVIMNSVTRNNQVSPQFIGGAIVQQRNQAADKVMGLMQDNRFAAQKENVNPIDPTRVKAAPAVVTPRQQLNETLRGIFQKLPEAEREPTANVFVEIFKNLFKDDQIEKFVINQQNGNTGKYTLHLKKDLKGSLDPVSIFAKKELQFTTTYDPVKKQVVFAFDNSSLQIGKGFIWVDAPQIEVREGRAHGVLKIGGLFTQSFDVALGELPEFLKKLKW